MEVIMNIGTIIRTVLVAATCLNTALMATDLSGFDNPTVNFWYRVISIVLNFIIVAATTYFNNDYTPQGAVGTSITRDLKADPTLIVKLEDGDEDDDDDEDDEDGDIEIGDGSNEVE